MNKILNDLGEYYVILDCYTDEPSGLGVPPFLSVHSRYLAGCLSTLNKKFYYITIDDLRYSLGETHDENTYNKRIINTTINKNDVSTLLNGSEKIYITMGCFVKYDYFSAEPGTVDELIPLFKKLNYGSKSVLFYSLGGKDMKTVMEHRSLHDIFSEVFYGNVYNYFFDLNNPFSTNYALLANVAISSASVMKHLARPLVIEIETASGCNRNPGCSFCIEGKRGLPLEFRNVDNIVSEIKALYTIGARYFRLGRQPNFYAYMNNDPQKIEELFVKIWECCPDIKTLHIDNVGPQDVPTPNGIETTKLIAKYCTSGNIAPFGIESFDPKVRELCNLNGTVNDIYKAIDVINQYGAFRSDSGLPQILPGINLIYNLDGQTNDTLDINLKNLEHILDSNMLVRRVFVRKLTSIYGDQFDIYTSHEIAEFKLWQKKILEQFAIPMMKKVFPIGLIIKDLRMEMLQDGNSYLRTMGTCPIRVMVPNKKLLLDHFYNVVITDYHEYRMLIGEILYE